MAHYFKVYAHSTGHKEPYDAYAFLEAYHQSLAYMAYEYIPEVFSVKNGVIEMQKIEGVTLGEYMFKQGHYRKRNEIVEKLKHAVSSLHKMNLIHNDITSENVMVDKDENFWIIDFGFASVTAKSEYKEAELASVIKTLDYTITYFMEGRWKDVKPTSEDLEVFETLKPAMVVTYTLPSFDETPFPLL